MSDRRRSKYRWWYPRTDWVLALLAYAILAGMLAAVSGCSYMPAGSNPSSRDPGRYLPDCRMVPERMNCTNYVPTVVSACEKRFGKALCEGRNP